MDVLSSGVTTRLARRVSRALARAGYLAGKVGNTSYRGTTVIRYGRGTSVSAREIATMFGGTAAASASVAAGHVEILLGASATVPHIRAAGKRRKPSVIPAIGPQGGAVTAQNGIPCVN